MAKRLGGWDYGRQAMRMVDYEVRLTVMLGEERLSKSIHRGKGRVYDGFPCGDEHLEHYRTIGTQSTKPICLLTTPSDAQHS